MMSFKQTHRTPLKSLTPPPEATRTHHTLSDTFPNLTPKNVIALQRIHGNQATQRLLTTRPTIQAKLIPKPRVTKSGRSFVNMFSMSQTNAYEKAKKAGRNDDDIGDLFQALIDSEDEYTYMQMEKIVVAQIDNSLADTDQTTRGFAYKGMNFIETSKSFTVQPGQAIETNGLREDVHSKWILLNMEFLIESPDDQIEDWELGFAQTVTSSDRTIVFTDDKDQAIALRLQLPAAKRDGGDDTLMPWFKSESVNSFGKQKLQSARVQFEDRPGFGKTLSQGEKMNRMTGSDTFKLVLMLRKKDGTDMKVLHTWLWRADYDNLAGEGALGITVDADAPGGNTANMVLDGARARNAFTTTQQRLTKAEAQLAGGESLPNQAAFKEMKGNAKKKSTFRSAMLPVKGYGKLVNQFNGHVNNSDWAQAKTVIDSLHDHLNLMDNKGNEYWRSDLLKANYFTPIYNAVKQQQQFINNKLGG